jgi:predicted kinase
MEALFNYPKAPNFSVPWDELDQAYDWVRALKGCPQDAKNHAEGDVWIHTRMVCEELAALPGYREAPPEAQQILFAAAVLHDVSKPECTREEPDGRITARGHSRHGELRARQILWRLGMPFSLREQVVTMIRYHQAPFWMIERDDPRRSVHRMSQTTRCDWLSLLAEADARGRICEDQQKILDNIELFRALCEEESCLSGPRQFPSAHSRFVYFRKEGRDPDYLAFDDTFGEVVMLSGLPGAGKDTWISQHLPDWPVVSLDDIRRERDVDPTENQGRVVQEAEEMARQHLRVKRSFVWNATSLSRQLRAQRLGLFDSYKARVRIVYLEVPEPVLLAQNRQREAQVPPAAILKMMQRWEMPDLTEAHAVDYVVRGLFDKSKR